MSSPAPVSALRLPEADARAVLLLRAFETTSPSPWTADDVDWATREARRREGGDAAPERFLATRARQACERLAERGLVL
ncbi:MAG TPA: hypothetical protein VF169_24015, partial [Albitalea sp.]